MNAVDSTIRAAISTKTIIEFEYDGYHRIAEPHVYGLKNGMSQLLVYQIEGQSSSGGLPQWRRFEIAKMSSLSMTSRNFLGRRPYPSGKHQDFDTVWLVVDP